MKKGIALSLVCAAGLVAAEIELGTIDVIEKKDMNVTQNVASLPTDTAKLLDKTAGVSFYAAGGISSLPVIHGMADDRVKTSIDGMQITSACPNHMNPALSYVDPSKVEQIEAIAGITPVSQGGDSIGGSIIVKTKKPVFGSSENMELQGGEISAFYKSNGNNQGASVAFGIANDKVSFSYAGMLEKSDNYEDGHGDEVRATLYKRNDQSATLGYKIDEENVVSLRVGRQEVPYEGFVNEYMDMLDNTGTSVNLSYDGKIGATDVEANVFNQNTSHYMNKILTERTGNMPMYTKAKESGYNIAATIPVNEVHSVKIGSDYDRYRLDDWWPSPTGTPGGMGPNTFWNINDGERDRFGLFAEVVSSWSDKLSSNMGIRTDIFKMNTGDVVGYNTSSNDPVDEAAFNALDHKKTDHNFDFTAMLQYENSASDDYEIGFARKTRSPNIYERYTWAGGYGSNPLTSGPIAMDMAMINWFGDGNGYVGNLDLKPEVAHTISASAAFHSTRSNMWNIKFTPYYTKVKNYIDVESFGEAEAGGYTGIQLLQFVNTDATLYGLDISGDALIWSNGSFGQGKLSGILTYTKGERDDGGNLYHMMPLTASVSLEQVVGNWVNGIDVTTVAKKDKVDETRMEPETSGYLLVDLRTNYKVTKNLSVDLAVTNLFDKAYALPLGGVNVVGVNDETYGKGTYNPLTGIGRSTNVALTYKF